MDKCFNCGCDLGPDLENMKMETEKGKLCYRCFNLLSREDEPEPPVGSKDESPD